MRTVDGASAPLNHERILVRPDGAPEDPEDDCRGADELGRATILTRDGVYVTGARIDPRFDPGRGAKLPRSLKVGARSHFATCPESKQARADAAAKRAARRAARG